MTVRYLVWDFETTGIPARAPGLIRPVQVGLTMFDDSFTDFSNFSMLVRPDVWAPGWENAQRVHGISRAALEKKSVPGMAESFQLLANHLRRSMATGFLEPASEMYSLAWNSAFDSEVLRLWMRAAGVRNRALSDWADAPVGPFTAPLGCLQAMYRNWTKTQPDITTPRYGALKRACVDLGLDWDDSQAHDASYDSRAAGRVAHEMLSRAQDASRA